MFGNYESVKIDDGTFALTYLQGDQVSLESKLIYSLKVS